MAATLGMVGTGSFSSDERPGNYREKILREYPTAPTPFLLLLGMLPSDGLPEVKFSIFEQDIPNQEFGIDASGGNILADATNLTLSASLSGVTNPAYYFKQGDIVEIEDDGVPVEQVIVLGAGSTPTTDIKVSRGHGIAGTAGTSGALILQNSVVKLVRIGNTTEEGGHAPTAVSYSPSVYENYCQTFRTPWEVSEVASRIKLRTGNAFANKKWDATVDHMMDIEKSLFFGTKSAYSAGLSGAVGMTAKGTEILKTGGVRYWLDQVADATNIADFTSSGVTTAGLKSWLRSIYTRPGTTDNKVAICGNVSAGVFTDYAEETGQINIVPKDETYGLHIKNIIHPWGELKLMVSPMFSRVSMWQDMVFVLDTGNLRYRYLNGMDTYERKDIQDNDELTKKNEWVTVCGLELQHANTHGYATGFGQWVS